MIKAQVKYTRLAPETVIAFTVPVTDNFPIFPPERIMILQRKNLLK